jgi:CheY-like chemotaxis protein
MPKGGRLTFESANVHLDGSFAQTHPDAMPGTYVHLKVSDTGTGMEERTLERIFEPFFTTKRAERHTGLGLATTYGIVQQSGGYLSVSSELGVGTTFDIYLPRHRASFVDAPDEVPVEPARGSETILLVEDEDQLRHLAAECLAGEGYTVFESADFEEAIATAAEHGDRVDLLITDVVLPTDSGVTLAEALERLHGPLKILFITGYTAEAVHQEHGIDPAIPLLVKPFSMSKLARTVRCTLDGSGLPKLEALA